MQNQKSTKSEKASRRRWFHSSQINVFWLPRTTLKHFENDNSDCVVIVGVSRPKLTLAIVFIILLSLVLSFHLLCQSALSGFEWNKRGPQWNSVPEENRINPGVAKVKPIRRLPQAIIIGVRKGGTRALLEMAHLHPMVQKASGEVHFFDRDENYNKGLEWYRSQMPLSYPGQVTIEKSPSYFVTPEVPERIRAMNASIKLILIVREPVTRAISDYTQLKANAATTTPPPSSYYANGNSISSHQSSNNRSFEQLTLLPNGTINEFYRPLVISMYHNFLHRWLEAFPQEQLLIVNGDLLIEDPMSQLKRMEEFLGLKSCLGPHNFYFNETKGFFCLRNETADRCLKETKGRKHPHVNHEVISNLRKYFSKHNQKFYELINEDLGWPED